jgi:hypothetical protein
MLAPLRRVPVFVAAVAALVIGAGAQQAATETWKSSEHGFALARPSTGWAFHEGASDGGFKLVVVPEGTAGTTGVAVTVKATEAAAVSELLEKALAFVDGREGYSDVERIVGEAAGREAPGLRVHITQGGQTYVFEAWYLLTEGRMVQLECWAPKADFDERRGTFESILASFRLVAPDADALRKRRLRELADRCGSEVDWATDWKEAERRARHERKPVLVFVWAYRQFDLSNTGLTGTFMQPEILDLVADRYVPLRWDVGQEAPFVPQQGYGLSGSTFGRALLVVSADGDVLQQTSTVHPAWALRFLRESLAGLPEPKGGVDAREPRGLVEVRRQVRAGASAEARAQVDAILARDDPGPDAPEALFWRGALDAAAADWEAAGRSWDVLIDQHADERWAWQAAAVLTSTVVELGYPVVLTWPTDAELDVLRSVPYEPAQPSHTERVGAEALAWLLRHQQENGAWAGTRDFAALDDRPNPFVDATAAIAGLALLDRADDEEPRAAAARALDYVLGSIDRARADEDVILYMDYTVWSRSWMLWFLGDCLDAGVGDAARIADAAAWLVDSLGSKQRRNGGWSYYHSSSADGSASAGEQSISFVTAGVTHALLRAEDAGVPVPAAVRDAALDVLEAMRNADGTFDYMLHVGGTATGGGNVPGAAGRSPVCELALHRGGRSDAKRVAGAVEQFLEHGDELSRELGKALMHAGAGGQGCHYLLFDYAFAALATNELPARARRKARTRVLELILEARSEEGSFQDTPINGWSYGTAMALLALGRSTAP